MNIAAKLEVSDLIERPTCPNCRVLMALSRIEPDRSNYDKRIFECVHCNRADVVIVKFR